MKRNKFIFPVRLGAVVLAAGIAGGCGSLDRIKREFLADDEKVDYRKAKTTDALEVPPDLTSSNIQEGLLIPGVSTTVSASQQGDAATATGGSAQFYSSVLPAETGVRMMRDGQMRWLEIDASPEVVWPRLREFWLQTGFLLKLEDPKIGLLETDWAENRADIPGDFITRQVSKLFDQLYSAATRDKFRVRLERVGEGVSELYLTHRGAQEVGGDSTGLSDVTRWDPRPRDPELENEMLARMLAYFGLAEERARKVLAAEAQPRAERAQLSREPGGLAMLSMREDFARAWQRTGLALDRVGFTVEDRNRAEGIYYVRYIDPVKEAQAKGDNGWLSGLMFWRDDEKEDGTGYQVKVQVAGDESRVRVYDKDGKPDSSDSAYRILSLLHEQLK